MTGIEAAGLVRRVADASDARATRVEATARGTRLLVDGRRWRVGRLAAGLRGFTAEEMDVLEHAAALLERVSARI